MYSLQFFYEKIQILRTNRDPKVWQLAGLNHFQWQNSLTNKRLLRVACILQFPCMRLMAGVMRCLHRCSRAPVFRETLRRPSYTKVRPVGRETVTITRLGQDRRAKTLRCPELRKPVGVRAQEDLWCPSLGSPGCPSLGRSLMPELGSLQNNDGSLQHVQAAND